MNITICSRKKMQKLIQTGFPNNTAVISFYDPDRILTDKNYKKIDYIGKAEQFIYIPLDDFQTSFPEAINLARFIKQAKSKELNIICQCESGQNRSAACAAAILEYYYHAGNTIFDDDKYYPDQMVYDKLLYALETLNNL